jgi:hypothetical protein
LAIFWRQFRPNKNIQTVRLLSLNGNNFQIFILLFAASNVRALLKLADRYECQLLIDRCEAHLMNCIEIPLVERINCANLYRLNGLKVSFFFKLQKVYWLIHAKIFKKDAIWN